MKVRFRNKSKSYRPKCITSNNAKRTSSNAKLHESLQIFRHQLSYLSTDKRYPGGAVYLGTCIHNYSRCYGYVIHNFILQDRIVLYLMVFGSF